MRLFRFTLVVLMITSLAISGCAHCLKGCCDAPVVSPVIQCEHQDQPSVQSPALPPIIHPGHQPVSPQSEMLPMLPPPISGGHQEMLPAPMTHITPGDGHMIHPQRMLICPTPINCPPNCCPDNSFLASQLAQTRQELSCMSTDKQLLIQERNSIQLALQERICALNQCEQNVQRLRQEKKEVEATLFCELQNARFEKERLSIRLEYLNQHLCSLKECLQQKEWRLEQCQEQMRCQMQQNFQQMQIQCLTKDLLAEKDMKCKEIQLEGARQQALTAYAMMAVNKPCCPPCGQCAPIITDMSKTTIPSGPCPITPFNTPMVTPVSDQAKAADQSKADQAKVDQAKADQSKSTDQAKSDQAKADQAKTDQAKADQSKADQAKADQAKADQAKADQSKTDQSKTDQAKTDQSKVDQSKVDQSKVDQSKVDQAKIDQSKVDQAKTVTPSIAAPSSAAAAAAKMAAAAAAGAFGLGMGPF